MPKGIVYLKEKSWVRNGGGKAKGSKEKLTILTIEQKDIKY